MQIWITLTIITLVIALVGRVMGWVRHEPIEDNTLSGVVTLFGRIGSVFFGMMTLLCIVG